MNQGNDTRLHDPVSEGELALKRAHFAARLEEQARDRREKDELRATFAAVERRLDYLERRLNALDGPPIPEAD